MSAQDKFLEIFNNLERIDSGEYSVSIALATCGESGEPQYRSLNISDGVAEVFATTVASSLSALKSFHESGDLVLREYSGGYKPDSHEIEYLEAASSSLGSIMKAIPSAADIPLLGKPDSFVDHVRFYTVLLEKKRKKRLVLFRRFNRTKELTRSKNIFVRWIGQRYERFSEPTFQFDERFDVILYDDSLFSLNKSNLHHIFRFYDLLRSVAEQSLATIHGKIPIANFDEFKESCLSHVQKLEKVRNISQKPYLTNVTMDKVRQTIETFQLKVDIVSENGTEKLLFDKSNRWEILNLLDDSYLGSAMTGNRYEVNSKRAL